MNDNLHRYQHRHQHHNRTIQNRVRSIQKENAKGCITKLLEEPEGSMYIKVESKRNLRKDRDGENDM
ncbi:hypothetical protein HCBG_02261 [Histoplasma capsulatum G186AR]|uniref:Uncharacterized protein n=1 Tax=Ajellomyces capsulatus (strain G186AR / H82 / ATCC MYA-2454 / RMSCC 2432) TaxID=447093 RepID=C0NIK4_AJECG|nr:uncharacterized protein HCBG_02261 [Histoplasma capsulatum G186AR]EEH08724.1 hypothetical protein HCBG_02261 [Histoplasma capsulatum G186AR]